MGCIESDRVIPTHTPPHHYKVNQYNSLYQDNQNSKYQQNDTGRREIAVQSIQVTSPLAYNGTQEEQKTTQNKNKIQEVNINLPDQQIFIEQILGLIIKSHQVQCVLTEELFEQILQKYNKNYWASDNKQQLISILLDYIKFSVSQISKSQKNETKYNLEKFAQQFGRDLYKILATVEMKKIWALETLRYSPNFMKKRFSLENNQQIFGMTDQVQNLCSKSSSGLVYLSYYLVRCCKDLEKNNIYPSNINDKLKPIVVSLKQKYSPENTFKQELKYNKNRSFEHEEVNKIPSMSIAYKKKIFIFKTANKEEELTDFIMEMVELGKKNFSNFTKLTSTCCLQNGGLNYKSNLKLKQRSQTMPLLRVKEKLLGDFIGQYYKGKTYNSNSIENLQKVEVKYLEESLKKVYEKMDSIEFIVTDILRGKCMFNKIKEINAAAHAIMNTIQIRASKGQDISLVSIDNRLMKITKDLMFRIRIQSIVCEFQIALKFNQAQNQIHHKMYQVERSKVFSPVTMLFNWHQSISKQFFEEVDKVLQKQDKEDTDTLSLHEMLQNLKNFMNYKTIENTNNKNSSIISKKDFEYLNKIKDDINSMKVSQQLFSKIYLRTGIVMYQIKQMHQSLINFQKHKQQFPEDFDVYVEIGYVFNKTGRPREAFQSLIIFFENVERLQQTMSIDQIGLKSTHKSVIEITNAFLKIGKFKMVAELVLEPIRLQLYQKHFDKNGKQYAKFLSLCARINGKLWRIKQAKEQFQNSISIFEKIDYSDDKDPDDPNYPQVYRLYAELYIEQGVFSKSLELLNKSQSLAQGMFGKQSLEAGEVLLKMGQVYQKMGRFEQAEGYYKKYEKLAEVLMTKFSTQFISSQIFLSKMYISFHKPEKARKILQECTQICQKIRDQSTLQQAQLANCFGKLLMEQKKLEQALQFFQKAVYLITKISQQSGTITIYYNNIAFCYQMLKKYDEAKKYYQLQQNTIKQSTGQDSIQLALCYNYIGNLYNQIQQYQEALKYLYKSKQILQKNQAENQKLSLLILQNIADSYFSLGRLKEGEEIYANLLSIDQARTGKTSMQFGNRLYTLYLNICKNLSIEEKKKRLNQILSIFKKNGNKDYGVILDLLRQLND